MINWQNLLTQIQIAYGQHPMPLAACLNLHAQLTAQNPTPGLLMSWLEQNEKSVPLEDPALHSLINAYPSGGMALKHSTLNLLAREIKRIHPAAILEFGCGLSTLALAFLMQRIHGSGSQPRVFSIDQGENFIAETRARLAAHQLEHQVCFLCAPLAQQRIGSLAFHCYDLPHTALEAFFGAQRPGFVLVDGPFGNYGVRFGTLPLVEDFLSAGAEVFMDDALRESELAIAASWCQMGFTSEGGFYWTGKGIFKSTFQSAASKNPALRAALAWLYDENHASKALPVPFTIDRAALHAEFDALASARVPALASAQTQPPTEHLKTALLAEGANYYQAGSLHSARKIFSAASKLFPGSTDILVNLGKTCLKLGLHGEAFRYLLGAVQIDPRDANAWALLLVIARQYRLEDVCQQSLAALRAIDPQHPLLKESSQS